ncbi:hypothetical protein [Dictyobacter arantiisoli]|uniref:Uncharacterized protein n=1 Tax=Dictyobacter arantiisoli TaxID=2014874 RepID=A0A5A5TC74_9CHLR|nr:hypothetical protein [Dictyobacter arantiisoli]GCF08746.1 hypothetical protein KDI_23100 [Dictyobacter arantiisoli]
MKKTKVQSTLYALAFYLLAGWLMACGISTHAQESSWQSSTPRVRALSTTPPVVHDGPAFLTHSGDGYTINYPANWIFSTNTTNAGNYQGDYFTDPLRGYSFHVYPSQDQTSPSQILDHLLTSIPGSQLIGKPDTITVNGIVWQQGKVLRTDIVTGQPLEIIGWVAKNPVAAQRIPYFVLHGDGSPTAFDTVNNTDFLVMLQSFHFTP